MEYVCTFAVSNDTKNYFKKIIQNTNISFERFFTICIKLYKYEVDKNYVRCKLINYDRTSVMRTTNNCVRSTMIYQNCSIQAIHQI